MFHPGLNKVPLVSLLPSGSSDYALVRLCGSSRFDQGNLSLVKLSLNN
uniref:Uncharacterized protein n=1 Tax=Nelumbo nucifera TaxID=4432 RepID=A0A822ZR58_NELNU|nr:TPA_asm: hypothetical protein HUJ06_016917 [Nelumbo nucifera]